MDPVAGARSFQVSGEAYDAFMGRYSRPLAAQFADAAGITAGITAEQTVLDVGCGPGRIVAALVAQGRFALGLDIASTAVRMARARRLTVLHRDVFGPLPGEGRWATVLLLDGNVGIGGDVPALLLRMRQLMAPSAHLVVETDPEAERFDSHVVRFALRGEAIGPEFRWCWVGASALIDLAAPCGFGVRNVHRRGGRTFVTLGLDL